MKNYEIVILDKETYNNYETIYKYKTDKYYDVIVDNGFRLELKLFSTTQEKSFDGSLFSDWLEEPISYGIIDDNKLIAFIEGSIESWHNVFRISNIHIDEEYRKLGLGTKLMNKMIEVARTKKCRGIVLETQSCNYPAISFYMKNGFRISRIDIKEYTNNDIDNKEVRLDLYLELK